MGLAQKAGFARNYGKLHEFGHAKHTTQVHRGGGTWALKPKLKKVTLHDGEVTGVTSSGGGLTGKGKGAVAGAGVGTAGVAGGTAYGVKQKKGEKVSKSAFGVDHEISKSLADPFKAVASKKIPKVGSLKPVVNASPTQVGSAIKRSQKTNFGSRLMGQSELPKSFTRNGR